MADNNTQSTKAKKKKVRSVSTSLLLGLLPITALAIIAIIVFTSWQSRDGIKEITISGLQETTESNARDLGFDVVNLVGRCDEIANTLNSVPLSESQIKGLVDQAKQFDPAMQPVLYIGWSDKSTVFSNDYVPKPDFDVTTRQWYKDGLGYDVLTCGEPYVDETSGSLCVTFSRKIKTPDGKEGVMGLDIFLDPLVKKVESYTPLGTGVTFLFSDDAILSYPDKSLIGQKISESNVVSLKALREFFSDENISSEPKQYDVPNRGSTYVSAARVPNTNWTLISSVTESDIMSTANRIQIVSLIIMVVTIVILSIVVFIIVNKIITKPVNKLADQISEVSKGDFTVDIVKGKDNEIGLIQSSMASYVDRMKTTLHKIHDNTVQLDEDATSSRDASTVLTKEATEQSQNMDSIAQVMDGMNHAVDELAQNATTLAQSVVELSDRGTEANETMEALVDKAKVGQRDMKVVTQNMTHISESMNDMNEVVKAIGESAEKINKIIEMINSISDQTNLLSLNASIEAARAGEAGKGFAVVAGEIGNLASDSSEATTEIGQILQDITSQISELSAKSEANVKEIKSSVEAVETAETTFEQIFEDLDKTGSSMEEMIEMMNSVNDVASSVAAISEEQSASAMEVNNTVSDLTQSARHVAAQSQDLDDSADHVSNSAKEITESISVFKI